MREPSGSSGYRLTEEQLLLRDTVRDLADERIAPRAAEIDRDGAFPWDVKEFLASQDVLALPFPERFGGVGADLLTLCIAIEQIARVCATSALIVAVQELGSLPLLLAGSPEQQERWFPDLASGRKLISFALTEAGAGSDVAAIATRAVRDGSGYRINGGKRFISQGDIADLVVVFARTDPEAKRQRGLSAFVVEKGMTGFGVVRLEHKLGIRGSSTAELAFDGVMVPEENRIGAEGDGFDIAMRTFQRSRPGIAAQAVGIAQGALEVASRYASQRVQFGRPIAEFQMIQAMLADMDAATESARQLLYRAATAIEDGAADADRWSALCKLVAGDAAMRVTTDAVQVLGGYGYVEDYPVERMMRDAKITQLYEGTQQIMRLVVAHALVPRH